MDNLVYPIYSLLCVSALTEVVIEIIKGMLPNDSYKDSVLKNGSIIVSMILAFVLQVSIFPESTRVIYWCGVILSGLIASRGANFIHSFGDTLHCISEAKKLDASKKNK